MTGFPLHIWVHCPSAADAMPYVHTPENLVCTLHDILELGTNNDPIGGSVKGRRCQETDAGNSTRTRTSTNYYYNTIPQCWDAIGNDEHVSRNDFSERYHHYTLKAYGELQMRKDGVHAS